MERGYKIKLVCFFVPLEGYRGGIVNPVATQERICAVCGRRDDDLVRARSLSGDFGEGEFRISVRLPPKPLGSLGEWLNWTETEAVATGGGKHFTHRDLSNQDRK